MSGKLLLILIKSKNVCEWESKIPNDIKSVSIYLKKNDMHASSHWKAPIFFCYNIKNLLVLIKRCIKVSQMVMMQRSRFFYLVIFVLNFDCPIVTRSTHNHILLCFLLKSYVCWLSFANFFHNSQDVKKPLKSMTIILFMMEIKQFNIHQWIRKVIEKKEQWQQQCVKCLEIFSTEILVSL